MDPLTALAIGGVVAIFSGVIKTFSSWGEGQKQAEQLEKQKAQDLAILDQEWEMAQKEAFEQADKLKLEADRLKEDAIEGDALTDITENIISQTFNAAIDDISMQEKQNAIQLQNEMIGTEAGLANMEVASGASGVRAGSGTNSEIIAQQRDLAQRNREQEQIMLDQAFQNNLMRVGLGLQQDKINIRGNRLTANRTMENSELTAKASEDLRASYSALGEGNTVFEMLENGGDQYKLYQKKRQRIESGYDTAIDDARNYDAFEYLSDFFGGASVGYKTGSSIYTDYYNAKSYHASQT